MNWSPNYQMSSCDYPKPLPQYITIHACTATTRKTPDAIDSAVDLYTISFIISNNVVKEPLAYMSMWHSEHTMQACMHTSVHFKYECVLCYLRGIQFLRNFIIILDHL